MMNLRKTAEEINRYEFCPADEEILHAIKDLYGDA